MEEDMREQKCNTLKTLCKKAAYIFLVIRDYS